MYVYSIYVLIYFKLEKCIGVYTPILAGLFKKMFYVRITISIEIQEILAGILISHQLNEVMRINFLNNHSPKTTIF